MEAARSEPLSFADQTLRFLERIVHRVATTPSEREAAFRLRSEAYQKAGILKSGAVDKLYDPLYDDHPLGWTTMTFVDGELAGTVRVNVGFDERAVLPGLRAFADVLAPRLRARQAIAELSCLAANLPLSGAYPQLAYVILRPAYMAAEHFGADIFLASPRAEQIAFYGRTFGAAIWREPRDYPGLATKLACMGADFHAARSRIEARYPFYKSTLAEREALFGRRRDNFERFGVRNDARPHDDGLGLDMEQSDCA